MQKGDIQIGFPQAVYKGTKAAVEALTGVPEGAIAYATNTNEFGSYDGAAWTWGQGSALIEDAINNGEVAKAPTENAVFDALALKQDSLGYTAENVANKDTDGTLAANSDTKYASQKAVKTYIDNSVTGLLELKGSTDCSSNPNYPAASKGDAYYVTVAGKIGGASGKSVDVGDVYVASADNAGGTEASVGTSWFVLEHNLTGALLAANNLSDVDSASSARSNLGLAIGTNVQAWDGDLDAIAALAPADDSIIQRKSSAWTSRTLAQLLTDLTEGIQDLVGTMFNTISGAGITENYNDTDGKVELSLDEGYVTTIINDTAIPLNGWILETATWTRTGNHTFTMSGDVTAAYRKGTKVRYKDGGAFEYGVIYSSSHSAGTTTITLITNSDYAMAAATITEPAYSYIENPTGFPHWFNWSTTWGQLTVGNATQTLKWRAEDKIIFFEINVILGSTSSVTGGMTFTPPATIATTGSRPPLGLVTFQDTGTALYFGGIQPTATTTIVVKVYNAAGTYLTQSDTSSTVPHTWASTDEISISGWFQY